MSVNMIVPTSKDRFGVDDPVTAYVQWRTACVSVWAAYRGWADAPKTDSALAHAAYGAALDREHAAAAAYARLVERAFAPRGAPFMARLLTNRN